MLTLPAAGVARLECDARLSLLCAEPVEAEGPLELRRLVSGQWTYETTGELADKLGEAWYCPQCRLMRKVSR